MRKIPEKMKQDILNKTPMTCMRKQVFNDHECQGRITLEHVWIYAGKQINEVWAIIKLCSWAHDVNEFQDGGNLDKQKNEYISLLIANDGDTQKYPRKNWDSIFSHLDKLFIDEVDLKEISKIRQCLK